MPEAISLKVAHCSRCGGDHKLEFIKMKNSDDYPDQKFKWFAMCPVEHQPILMRLDSCDAEIKGRTKTQKEQDVATVISNRS